MHIPISDQLKLDIEKVIRANEESHALSEQHLETQIMAAVNALELSQTEQRRQQVQLQQAQQQHERFLDSLSYDEINRRLNEISESHSKTFEWVFNDDVERPWDSFPAWLKGSEKLYWINGKAGSGKSTLMKFIANESRTSDLLSLWSASSEVLIITSYFWLSGSKMQRSLKGFLCNIVRQIVLYDKHLIEKIFQTDEKLLRKRNIDDWSVSELRRLLKQIADLLVVSACFFIDGLDEFDQDDKIKNLLDVIEQLIMADKIKICISSRPEIYLIKRLAATKKMRLQDLTAKDIERYTRIELDWCFIHKSLASVDEAGISCIVSAVVKKADGVFLWVYYALKSVTRGLERVDDLRELLDRVEILPKEIHRLFLQIWERLNGDDPHYRDEAATYFWYAKYATEDYKETLSVFTLWVALDQEIQKKYLTGLTRLDCAHVAKGCERLEMRIMTRCAGLLEIFDDGRSRKDSGAMNNTSVLDDDQKTFPNYAPSVHSKRTKPMTPYNGIFPDSL